MLPWLNANAPAIQAICTVATVLLTLFLGLTTLWYARLTGRLAELSRIQFSTNVRPNLEILLKSGDGLPLNHVEYRFHNIGEHPVSIWNVVFTIHNETKTTSYRSEHFYHWTYAFRTLMPEATLSEIVDLTPCAEIKPRWVKRRGTVIRQYTEVHVDCSDLSHSAQHCFIATTQGAFEHSPHFFVQPSRSRYNLVYLSHKAWAWLSGNYRDGVWTVKARVARPKLPPKFRDYDFR